jgi:acetyl-CoA synthetase (ADP-forming)
MTDPGAGVIAAALGRGAPQLSEDEAKEFLRAWGVPTALETLARDVETARRAAAEIGYPVVVKGCGAGIAHKTEHGLVEMDVRDAAGVGAAFERLTARMGPGGAVLVQEMVRGARELAAGLVRDRQYGPCVMFGLGGVFAEALADVTFRLAPIDRGEARAMLEEIRGACLLGALRGLPAVDRDVLADVLVALGRIGVTYPTIREIDINPLIVRGATPVAVDALIVLGRPGAAPVAGAGLSAR